MSCQDGLIYTDYVQNCNLIFVRRGRPKAELKATDPAVRKFFEECDKLRLSLTEIHAKLKCAIPDAPSYRALQEWRRGTHQPRFVTFGSWIKILEKK
jgi:hypothetical protein